MRYVGNGWTRMTFPGMGSRLHHTTGFSLGEDEVHEYRQYYYARLYAPKAPQGHLFQALFDFNAALDTTFAVGLTIAATFNPIAAAVESGITAMDTAVGVANGTLDGGDVAMAVVTSMPGVPGSPGAGKLARTGRGKNHLGPDERAIGAHSTWKRDPSTGNVTGHAEWRTNARSPSGFDQVKRVDTQYANPHTHVNKKTGAVVPTPHAHDPSTPGGVRPARPDELPE
jgi:hypothetical protein